MRIHYKNNPPDAETGIFHENMLNKVENSVHNIS